MKFFWGGGLVRMTFRLVHCSYSLPKGQAQQLVFFALCRDGRENSNIINLRAGAYYLLSRGKKDSRHLHAGYNIIKDKKIKLICTNWVDSNSCLRCFYTHCKRGWRVRQLIPHIHWYRRSSKVIPLLSYFYIIPDFRNPRCACGANFTRGQPKRLYIHFHPPQKHPRNVCGEIIRGRTGYHM